MQRPSEPVVVAPRLVLELTGQSETDDFICHSMVRPEVRAIKSQRTALKWNFSQIQDFIRPLQIQTGDTPVFVPLLRSAQNVNGAAEKGMSANLGSDIIGL